MKTQKPVRKRNRLRSYNYSRDGLYYFTSNVKHNACSFGEIKGKELFLNAYGLIVWQQWYWLAEQYPYVVLHSFVVMPNHIHGIIEINRENMAIKHASITACKDIEVKIKPVFDLIGALKMTSSKLIGILQRIDNPALKESDKFAWHRSFHDHVIRSLKSYQRIVKYIQNNPANWKKDEYFQ